MSDSLLSANATYHNQWLIQEFREGSPYNLTNFSRTLDESEEILALGDAHRCASPGSATDNEYIFTLWLLRD